MSKCPFDHQSKTLTNAGAPVVDNDNTMSAGPERSVIATRCLVSRKLAHFARERIPERVVHAKGSAAIWDIYGDRRYNTIYQSKSI